MIARCIFFFLEERKRNSLTAQDCRRWRRPQINQSVSGFQIATLQQPAVTIGIDHHRWILMH